MLPPVDQSCRQDPDRDVEALRRPPQQVKSLLRSAAVLSHQDDLGLLDHRRRARPVRAQGRGSGL
jgi:hypothetical protein